MFYRNTVMTIENCNIQYWLLKWNKSKYSVTVPVLQGSFDPPIESRQKKLDHAVYPDVKP